MNQHIPGLIKRIFIVTDSGQNRVYFRPHQNMDFKNSLRSGRRISNLLLKPKPNQAHPWWFWVIVITDMHKHLCKHHCVVKHKSLLHTSTALQAHSCLCERVDSHMHLSKASLSIYMISSYCFCLSTTCITWNLSVKLQPLTKSFHFENFLLASPMQSTNRRAFLHLDLLSGLTWAWILHWLLHGSGISYTCMIFGAP